MGTIKSVYNKMRVFSLENTAETVFAKLSDAFTEENKEQLYAGFDKFEERLLPYRQEHYATIKNEMNPSPGFGNPDLFKTGAFYAGISTSIVGQSIIEESSDKKNEALVIKYGQIFGLGGKFKVEFVDNKLAPAFFIEARKRIFG